MRTFYSSTLSCLVTSYRTTTQWQTLRLTHFPAADAAAYANPLTALVVPATGWALNLVPSGQVLGRLSWHHGRKLDGTTSIQSSKKAKSESTV
jgi:hypothetical protein